MPFADVANRVAEIEALAQSAVAPLEQPPAATAFPAALSAAATATLLPTDTTTAPAPVSTLASVYTPVVDAGSDKGGQVLAAAESQVGASEQPPGSNDGPQLAVYRSAVAGAAPGEPWCAYFASWAAAQGGVPLGDGGSGLGAVSQITDWASRTGRLLPGSATPSPGDLILFGDRHVGVVESVNADGSLTTVEGNYANAVSRVHRSPAEATGYVRL